MTMPAGKYYVGDLCYVMSDEEWEEFCSITIVGNKCVDGEFQFADGRRFATYGTAFGDGTYHDQYGHSYSVDAGLIGCILVSNIRNSKYENLLDLGAIIEFDADFATSGGRGEKNWDGDIQIGHMVIETDGNEYEEFTYDEE